MDKKENTIVNSIKKYLQDHIYDDVCLWEVCEYFHMSKSFVCNVFHEDIGCGIIEYHRALKIEEAKRLIRGTEWNVTKIANELGYTSIHQFSRSFKRETGMSPSAYRKMLEESKKMERNT